MKKEIDCSETALKNRYSHLKELCEEANSHYQHLNDKYDGVLGDSFGEYILEKFAQKCRTEFVLFHRNKGMTISLKPKSNILDLSGFSDEQANQYIQEYEHNLDAMSTMYLTEDFFLNDGNLDTNYEGSANRYTSAGMNMESFNAEYLNIAKYHHMKFKIDRLNPPAPDENESDLAGKLKI
jgi:hypothetical protein